MLNPRLTSNECSLSITVGGKMVSLSGYTGVSVLLLLGLLLPGVVSESAEG